MEVASSAELVGAVGHVAFQDLISLSDFNPSVFSTLYYDREQEYRKLQSIIDNMYNDSMNVLVVGEAGVGKSNFLHKLLHDQNLFSEAKLFPILVDYRAVVPLTPQGCLSQFIESMEKYFDAVGAPINTLQQRTSEFIDLNIQAIYRHLHGLAEGDVAKRPFIILDDFDYADEDWFYLLEYFLPFAASHKSSILLSIRSPLLTAINDYDDRFCHHFVRDVQRIDLEPLDVGRVISHRLAIFLSPGKQDSLYSRIINRLRGAQNPLRQILDRYGIDNLDQLDSIEYPFTEKHNTFMTRISNGNLREIFDIALDSLIYIYDRGTRTEPRIEQGVTRQVIGREGVMKLFYDEYRPKKTAYKLLNLHRQRNVENNSLLFNTLECVKLKQAANEQFYAILGSLGHRKEDVDRALEFLAHKNNRLICETHIRVPRGRKGTADGAPEYRVTDKGDYYLQICRWPEYIDRCGETGLSAMEVPDDRLEIAGHRRKARRGNRRPKQAH